jgi:alkylation response protein AidB-like acyl-CoA dehydrogenase
LRAWLARTLPELPPSPHRGDWASRKKYDLGWQKRLFDAGYAGMSWPVEYGGRGAAPGEQLVFLEEMAAAGAPTVGVNFVGLLHAGPTLMVEATPEQRTAHLPKILRGDEVWCQGFSEPNAGSDLASLRTRAVRDGEEYVINGQKIWSSFAHVADWGEVLVRTDADAPKHKGISWLMVDMKSPGITIRPIDTALGSSEFCEVFFDEVRVPIANRVGLENDGWRVAMVTFGFERGTGFVGELMEARRHASDIAALAKRLGKWDDAGLRRELGTLGAEFDAMWALTKRNVTQATSDGVPGPGGSVLKLRLTEAAQELYDVARRLIGRAGLTFDDIGDIPTGFVIEERLRSLGFTLGGGTTQIQRNIVGERILGLPKEPAPAP